MEVAKKKRVRGPPLAPRFGESIFNVFEFRGVQNKKWNKMKPPYPPVPEPAGGSFQAKPPNPFF